jgi:uncharacterized protein YdeI (YjbR/CyaY-like superfamily)
MKFRSTVELGGKTATGIEVPPAFAKALDRDAKARKLLDGLSYSHQRRWVMSIEDAKTAETRRRRIDKAVSMLRDGGK